MQIEFGLTERGYLALFFSFGLELESGVQTLPALPAFYISILTATSIFCSVLTSRTT